MRSRWPSPGACRFDTALQGLIDLLNADLLLRSCRGQETARNTRTACDGPRHKPILGSRRRSVVGGRGVAEGGPLPFAWLADLRRPVRGVVWATESRCWSMGAMDSQRGAAFGAHPLTPGSSRCAESSSRSLVLTVADVDAEHSAVHVDRSPRRRDIRARRGSDGWLMPEIGSRLPYAPEAPSTPSCVRNRRTSEPGRRPTKGQLSAALSGFGSFEGIL